MESELSPVNDGPPVCSDPYCLEGNLDYWDCRCFKEKVSKSVCPKGTYEIVNRDFCSCERKINPTCPKGARFDMKSCTCSISETPTCPRGGTVLPHTALCIGTVKPECQKPFVLQPNCQCAMTLPRQCLNGGKLSKDGCECRVLGGVTKPVCSRGCLMNEKCRCTSFYGKNVFLHVI